MPNMRRFRLIVIGDEILSGRRQDKHMAKLIELLSERGLQLSGTEYVGDDPEQITATLKRSFASGDIVFCTGGIGSTPDDHTRQCAAQALGLPLHLHSEARDLILNRIRTLAAGDPAKASLDLVENKLRLQMGEFPVGSAIIPNSYNQIPGFSIHEHYFTPGFPVMAEPMMIWVLDTIYPDLCHRQEFAEKSFIVPLAMEAQLTPLMQEIESRHASVKVFSLPSVGDPARSGIFAKRQIELGVKGSPEEVRLAYDELKAGVISLGNEVHEVHK